MPDVPRALCRPVSRRAALGLGALGIIGAELLAGCSSGRSPERSRVAATRPPEGLPPDVQIATRALEAVSATRLVVDETVRRFPATRPVLGGLRAMHAAHERVLVDAVPRRVERTPGAVLQVPDSRLVALRQVRASELGLRTSLQSLALQAESGEFARLLASMAAGVSVRLTELPA